MGQCGACNKKKTPQQQFSPQYTQQIHQDTINKLQVEQQNLERKQQQERKNDEDVNQANIQYEQISFQNFNNEISQTNNYQINKQSIQIDQNDQSNDQIISTNIQQNNELQKINAQQQPVKINDIFVTQQNTYEQINSTKLSQINEKSEKKKIFTQQKNNNFIINGMFCKPASAYNFAIQDNEFFNLFDQIQIMDTKNQLDQLSQSNKSMINTQIEIFNTEEYAPLLKQEQDKHLTRQSSQQYSRMET